MNGPDGTTKELPADPQLVAFEQQLADTRAAYAAARAAVAHIPEAEQSYEQFDSHWVLHTKVQHLVRAIAARQRRLHPPPPKPSRAEREAARDRLRLPKLEAKLARVTAQFARVAGTQTGGPHLDDVRDHFHLGMVGGSGPHTARLNRQRERSIERTIDNAKRYTALNGQKNGLEHEIRRIKQRLGITAEPRPRGNPTDQA